jgi:hypothetical protein
MCVPKRDFGNERNERRREKGQALNERQVFLDPAF